MKLRDEDLKYLPALWEAVDERVPGAFITEAEADHYVAGLMPPDQLAIVEALLDKTPEFRDKLKALREEYLKPRRVQG